MAGSSGRVAEVVVGCHRYGACTEYHLLSVVAELEVASPLKPNSRATHCSDLSHFSFILLKILETIGVHGLVTGH